MSVWPGFVERLGERGVFARIDIGFTVGDWIVFVCGAERASRMIVRKEPCLPVGWVLLTVEAV